MPTLNEGTLLYMPVTLPGLSVTKAAELLQTQDQIIKSFPEVASVFGKAGRAATATDPAPIEMVETVINLKPETEWRPGVTVDRLIAEMDQALQLPGVSNAWTMPIKARIDMLSTGIRTPVGVKVFGTDLGQIERLATAGRGGAARACPARPARSPSGTGGGHYLDIKPDRAALARYGLTVGDVQETILTALGGEPVTTTVEGRERYTVNVRYPRDLRDDPEAIAREVLVAGADGVHGPARPARLGPADPRAAEHPHRERPARRPTSTSTRASATSAATWREAQRAVAEEVRFPPGTYAVWSGQFEYLQRAEARLRIVVPATLLVIFVLLYLNFGRLAETLIVMLSVPFALVGGVWLDVLAGLQHERRGGRRLHRAGRRRRRDRRGDADLSRPCAGERAGAAPGRGAAVRGGGPAGARSSRARSSGCGRR